MAFPEEGQTKDSSSPVRSGNRQCEQVFPCRRRAVFRDSDLVSHQDINSHIFNFRSGEIHLVGAMQRKPSRGQQNDPREWDPWGQFFWNTVFWYLLLVEVGFRSVFIGF